MYRMELYEVLYNQDGIAICVMHVYMQSRQIVFWSSLGGVGEGQTCANKSGTTLYRNMGIVSIQY